MNKPNPVRLSNPAEVAEILADTTLTAPHLVEHEGKYHADPRELRLWRESQQSQSEVKP
jgi:hypothetical protein